LFLDKRTTGNLCYGIIDTIYKIIPTSFCATHVNVAYILWYEKLSSKVTQNALVPEHSRVCDPHVLLWGTLDKLVLLSASLFPQGNILSNFTVGLLYNCELLGSENEVLKCRP
jgi:hypothetical protein